MSNFRHRQTGFLLPPSVDEWLPQRHLARFVVEMIDGLDVLTLEGKREPKVQEDNVNWQRRERAYGTFSRTVQLPFRVLLAAHPHADGDTRQAPSRAGPRTFAAAEGGMRHRELSADGDSGDSLCLGSGSTTVLDWRERMVYSQCGSRQVGRERDRVAVGKRDRLRNSLGGPSFG
jgi:hypothetical protein